MTNASKRRIKEGLGFGILAGLLFAVMEIVAAAAMGNPPLAPVRMFASTVLGQAALQTTPLATALIVGLIVHLVLSGAYGAFYGFVNDRLSVETETSWARQAGLGLAFGAVIWLVNFQIIARILYPWFLGTPQVLQLLMHAFFFGLPLALFYAAAERRVHVGTPERV